MTTKQANLNTDSETDSDILVSSDSDEDEWNESTRVKCYLLDQTIFKNNIMFQQFINKMKVNRDIKNNNQMN